MSKELDDLIDWAAEATRRAEEAELEAMESEARGPNLYVIALLIVMFGIVLMVIFAIFCGRC